jgi:hypothetical protein
MPIIAKIIICVDQIVGDISKVSKLDLILFHFVNIVSFILAYVD